MRGLGRAKLWARRLLDWPNERRSRRLSRRWDIDGYRRVYLYHVRKVGGTSLNKMFLSLGDRDGEEVFELLERSEFGRHRAIVGGKVFVGWSRRLIENGNWFYAFSHLPAHEIRLPPKTFTITILREPVERLLSHYNMLLAMKADRSDHACMATEGRWLGGSFAEFLSRTPRDHLQRQLFMFSKTFDVAEAVEGITSCGCFFFLDSFEAGVRALAERLGLPLRTRHERRGRDVARLSSQDIQAACDALGPETELYAKLRDLAPAGVGGCAVTA